MVPETAVRKQRYHIDLQALHAECETNYFRLLKLLPALAVEDHRCLVLETALDQQRRYQFSVMERTRYTATLEISESGCRPCGGLSASFTVRLYHDARMAEVLAFQRTSRHALHYPGADLRRFLPDEKRQWNDLLGEWLTHCPAHGYSPEPAFTPAKGEPA